MQASASWGSWGLQVTGEGVTPHLRSSKNKGRDDGRNPAIAKVKYGEPCDALHDDDVGQVKEEEQVVTLEQVHVLSGLPEGPEVLDDLGLWSKPTGKASAPPATVPHDRCHYHMPAWAWHSPGDCVLVHSQVSGRESLQLKSLPLTPPCP